jgi:hypothetical protein
MIPSSGSRVAIRVSDALACPLAEPALEDEREFAARGQRRDDGVDVVGALGEHQARPAR